MAGPSIPPNLHRLLNPHTPPPPFSSLHTEASTMDKTLQDPLETNLEEWEFLPDNTSFFQFGLDEIEDLISNEIIYTDYFREEPKLIQQAPAHDQDEEAQLKNISISHVFFKIINPQVDAELIEKTTRPSSEPKQRMVELVEREIEAPPSVLFMEEKVLLGEKGDLEEEEEKAIWEGIGIGIWRWRLMGVGALFSVGAAAAATICVVAFGGREAKESPYRRRHQRNIVQFHFHDEDKVSL